MKYLDQVTKASFTLTILISNSFLSHATTSPKKISPDTISVAISYGELIDKLTILEIKSERIKTRSKLDNIEKELLILSDIYLHNIPLTEEIESFKTALKQINEQLWEIEDDIRLKEQNKEFDDEFIELARLVYITNDLRGEIKKRINECLGSYLTEEKEYTHYERLS
ncbi:MAG: DUF6165 family protein [Candidatus Babeliales bacterium]|jgi:Family of unknown function (DUF6165)